MPGHWIGVACAAHVRRGRAGGFMQLGHGKVAPLLRIKPGDRIICYSPTQVFGKKDGLQSFTAIGKIKEREPYLFDRGKGFKPYRRDVQWARAKEAPIAPLLDKLEFTAGQRNWGYKFRFGLFPISAKDFRLIAKAMGALRHHRA
jgi:EVE domain